MKASPQYSPFLILINTLDKIAFRADCLGCMEAVFKALKGVTQVTKGMCLLSHLRLHFLKPLSYITTLIPLEQRIEGHLNTLKTTNNHSFRETYNAAMYYYKKEKTSAFAKAKQA